MVSADCPQMKSPVLGSRWLAGGRNVYKPVEITESYLIPGWVQSMEPRAKRAYMRRMINKLVPEMYLFYSFIIFDKFYNSTEQQKKS